MVYFGYMTVVIHHRTTKGDGMLRIKLLRLSTTRSQWHIAQAAQMSQGRLSMVERGLIKPTEEERERLTQVLHATASTLFRPACRVRATATTIAGVE